MQQNTMLSLRVSKELRRKINALRRGTKPRKSQAQVVREALEAYEATAANEGAAALQEKTPVRHDEIAAA